jgi:hypothetical protein
MGVKYMKFNNINEVKEHFDNYKYEPEVHEAIEFLLSQLNDIKHNEFVGTEITDFYCNGFFGRRYDLEGSIIISSGKDFITVRTLEGDVETAYFSDGWESQMRDFIQDWTK